MANMTRDIADIKEKLAALETVTSSLEKQQTAVLEFEALREENCNLQSQVLSLSEAYSRMQENMDTFQQNVEKNRGDFSNLQKEFQAIKAINIKLQNDVDSSQRESLLIKTVTKKLQDDAEELSKGFKTFKASNLVAFNARLHEDSPADSVILSKVDCNVGQAYDNTTGIFTVPVTGIYFFMASAMAVQEPNDFYMQIMVENSISFILGLFYGKPHHGMNCTVHKVKRLKKGQMIRLYVRCNVYLLRNVTSFSGVLVQPEFDIV